MKIKPWAALCAVSLAIVACSLLGPGPATVTPSVEPSVAPSEAPITPLPSGTGPCMVESAGGITTYTRPSFEAEVFSTVGLAPPTGIGSRTDEGWLGFDPAKAQAANIGIFRLRWIPPGAPISLSGDCASVPIADWVPEAGICYEMVMQPTGVHAAADAASPVTGTLNVGDFAAIEGRTASGWLVVNGDKANSPGINGYIGEQDANVNGPCDALPQVP